MFKLLKCNSKYSEQKVLKLLILLLSTHPKINKLCWLLHQTDKRLNPQQLVLHGKTKQEKSPKKNFNFLSLSLNFWAQYSLSMKSSMLFTRTTHYQMRNSTNLIHSLRFLKVWDHKTTSRKSVHSCHQFAISNAELSLHLKTLK